MPIKFGNTTIDKIIYNGTDLDEVYYGTTLVWQKPTVYDGSRFGGALKNGIISGPSIRAYGSVHGTVAIDQASRGSTYTEGAVSISEYFTHIRSDGSSAIYGGFVTVDPINLTNISTISINERCYWWVRDIQTSSPDQVGISIDQIYYCTKQGSTYVSQGSIRGSGGAQMLDGNNGYNTTTGTSTFNTSSVTGSYYLYFNFMAWCEVVNHDANCVINSIVFA